MNYDYIFCTFYSPHPDDLTAKEHATVLLFLCIGVLSHGQGSLSSIPLHLKDAVFTTYPPPNDAPPSSQFACFVHKMLPLWFVFIPAIHCEVASKL